MSIRLLSGNDFLLTGIRQATIRYYPVLSGIRENGIRHIPTLFILDISVSSKLFFP